MTLLENATPEHPFSRNCFKQVGNLKVMTNFFFFFTVANKVPRDDYYPYQEGDMCFSYHLQNRQYQESSLPLVFLFVILHSGEWGKKGSKMRFFFPVYFLLQILTISFPSSSLKVSLELRILTC